MSRNLRRRIIRGDGVEASTAALLVHVPGTPGAHGGDLNAILAQARKEGYEEGYQAATTEMAAAEAAGRAAQLRRVSDALTAAATEVAGTRREAVELSAVEAAELSFELAEAVLERELSLGRPAYDGMTRALRLVPDEQDLVVRINPGDSIDPGEIQELVPDVAVKVVADPKVEPGGCVVVAGPCRIDAQISSALARARQVLEEIYRDEGVVSG